MIVDNIKILERLELNNDLKQGFNFIKKAVAEKLALGKYEIDGQKVYAIVQEYNTKPLGEGKFEAHRKYIDIQYVISGEESIKIANIDSCKTAVEYNGEKDVEFFEQPEAFSDILLKSGDFAIFYPWDVHCPAISPNGNNEKIEKIVVKVSF